MTSTAALQIRSGYSLMKSTIQIPSLIDQAKQLGYRHLALTDEGVLHGAIPFYQMCKKAGVNPIIGLVGTINLNDQAMEVIWLARNYSGYRYLLEWSTRIQHDQHLSVSDVQEADEHIITIIPADQREADHLQTLLDSISVHLLLTNLYIGVTQKMISHRSTLEQVSINKIALTDTRYLHKQDSTAYSCIRAMDQGQKWNRALDEELDGTHLLSLSELEQSFLKWPELLTEADRVAQSCHVELPLNQRLLPKYPLSHGVHADHYLEELCENLLQKKYHSVTDEITDRLHYEVDVIQSMGFSDYFLIVWDFVHYAKENNIMVGPGRGSAAGSLVAYLLGITDVDPIKYDLLFERFLNPERVTMPDIDIDFSDERRDEVIRYVVDKYGSDHVAQIVTFGTFAARSLLRELFKTLEISDNDAAYILKSLPKDSTSTIAAMLKQTPELTEYVKQSDQLKHLFKIANRLEGLPRHISTHAAGVIISDEVLSNHVATMPSQNNIKLTQYAMNDLATVGLLKMDFLGLRNLTLIEKIVKQIKYQQNTDIDLDKIPFDDAKTYQLLQRAETNGVFQLESQGMQKVLRELKPTNFEDIVAVNALYRPGPMEFIPSYIERKHHRKKVEYLHLDLEDILAKTYGVLVYQEQIMQIVNKMAGFSYGEADILRRAVSKKDKGSLLENKQKFLNGCRKNGYIKEVAEEVFDWIVRFSNYGFNRSHAVAYSVIAYQLAYLKANYPIPFFIEMLSMNIGNVEKTQIYLREAKNRNITIFPPSINNSIGKFREEKNGIRLGLNMIKGVGFQAVQAIIQARKEQRFKSLFDFCLRVSLQKINRAIIESLILAGAFDELHENRATLLASLDEALEQGELFKEFDDQLGFFEGDLALDVSYTETDPFPIMRQLMMEREVIGFFVSTHPLAQVRDQIRQFGYITIQQAANSNRKNVKIAAVIQAMKVIRTKKGETMAFVTIADETVELEGVLFPNVFRQVNHWLEEDVFVYIQGKVEDRKDKKQIIINDIQPYQLEEKQITKDSIYIKVVDDSNNPMEKLKEMATKYPGSSTVYFYKEVEQKLFKLPSDFNVDSAWNVIKELKAFFGEDNVVIKHTT
ncbi:DNA polymerase III subunit alpha [Gracilibacillus kekensis]|uniref:DNA polymerase III subunit alpha n=1 Tax=Gracilibacillus kekensis TaxID=1027249 RepID=A0A1M7NPK4_9BACI|nr:DNA polymerase III subunit alpha [Gracilibacillus kekensis]SHN05906.1 DNA polymerase III catalytic subunit, DnaE type [Gracilibacillus kekensis]